MKDIALVWFRRDLRLADHPALAEAMARHERLVPVYIHDPEADGDWPPGAASRWWLHHALSDLDRSLRERGSRLTIRQGKSVEALERLLQETDAAAVYWNRLYEPARVQHDRKLKSRLREQGITTRSFRAAMLYEPWELAKGDGTAYRVFTPYWNAMQRAWRPVECIDAPRKLPPVPRSLASESIDTLELRPGHDWADRLAACWSIGESSALEQAEALTGRVQRYHESRDRPDQNGTSRLSPYLHFGQISPARAVAVLSPSGELPSGRGALAFVRELAWREFSMTLLYAQPTLPDSPLQPRFEDFPWRARNDYAEDLERWQAGRTGVPLVDAGMRELWATGWMHNRVRMVAASWLTKNLLIPWQEGARWFWDTLVDADLANNTQGWQWTAGCGADAAPYFRVFNPERQAEKFDPDGAYIRRWCEELSDLDSRALSRLDDDLRHRCGYPEMQVDLQSSRQRALDAFDEIRGR